MRTANTLRGYLQGRLTLLPIQQAIREAVAAVAALQEQNAGATYNLYFGNQSGQRLYSVSVFPERSRVTGGKNVRLEVLLAFLQENHDLLADPRCCIGTWYNPEEDVTYLDIVVALTNKRSATSLGRRYNQIGIFDLQRFVVIPTGGTGDSLADLPSLAERLPALRRKPT